MKTLRLLKKKFLAIFVSICVIFSILPQEVWISYAEEVIERVKIDEEHFPQIYKILRYEVYDKNQDGWLSKNEIKDIKYLYVNEKVSSLKGIEYLTSMEMLIVQKYTAKNLSISDSNYNLETLYINPTASSFSVKSKYLKRLIVTSVDGKYYFKGTDIFAKPVCGYGTATATKSLSVKGCEALQDLYVTSKNIVNYTFSDTIKRLEIRYNRVKELSLSTLKNLELLRIESCDYLTNIKCTTNAKLKYLQIENCLKLKNVNFKGLQALEYLYIGSEVGVRTLDLSKNTKIKMAVIDTWGHDVNVTMPKGKKSKLTKYDPDKMKEFYEASKIIWNIFYDNGIIQYVDYKIEKNYQWNKEKENNDGGEDYYHKKIVKWDKTEFPELYEGVFSYNIDFDNDGWLTQVELDSIHYIRVEKNISNLKGLEYFRLVDTIDLKNYTGSTLELTSKNARLSIVKVHTNRKTFKVIAPYIDGICVEVEKGATKVDLSKCGSVEGMRVCCEGVNESAVSELIMPKGNKKIRYIDLSQLNLKSFRFKDYPNLEILTISMCKNMKTLDVTKNKQLRAICFTKHDEVKRTYDLSECTRLEEIYVWGYKNSLTLKKPKGRLLPKRDTNFFFYEVLRSVDVCYKVLY